jgi:hypothetical protein
LPNATAARYLRDLLPSALPRFSVGKTQQNKQALRLLAQCEACSQSCPARRPRKTQNKSTCPALVVFCVFYAQVFADPKQEQLNFIENRLRQLSL